MTVEVSVVICTYKRYEFLPAAVDSLVNQSAPQDAFEIIVVDNSPDSTLSEKASVKYRGIANLTWVIERKPGLSNARNVGLGLAKGAYVAYMDDDAIAGASWVATVIKTFREWGEKVAAIGGQVSPIWGAPRPGWLDKGLASYVSAVDWGGSTRDAGEKEWIVGTNIAFRVAELRAVGGFSVALGRNGNGSALLSNEEVEILDKLKARGGRALYVPEMKLEHLVEPGRLTQEWFRRRMIWQATSDYLKDPETSFKNVNKHWWGVKDYFNRVPPIERTPRGFFAEKHTADELRDQLSALYNFQMCMLAGFHGIEPGGG